MERVSIVIPVFNPENNFFDLVSDLISRGIHKIIIVNDGSEKNHQDLFDKLKQEKNCVVLEHQRNMGKGRALKTGFDYFIKYCSNDVGLISVDADGQHLVDDVVKLAAMLNYDSNSIILGSRNFNVGTPLRSRFGNFVTKYFFYFITGIKISDTQTGLRAIPRNLVGRLTNIIGERYDYELNMLLSSRFLGVELVEEPISTVYIDNNSTSHFRPLVDSIKIYFVFIRFLFSSLSSAVVDFSIFWFFFSISNNIFYSLVGARLLASAYNFLVNKKLVFRRNGYVLVQLLKYYGLAGVVLFTTYYFIKFTTLFLGWNVIFSKIIIEILLFIFSFHIQRKYIFRR